MKALNFGSLNIDYVYEVEHFVQKGETISSNSLQVFSGGKGLN
ncbi:MAG: ribokinase, partial [Epulopiscium sp.]|nr:ribokinase [Candidatus Epulonipiscium sp.]